MPDTAVGHDPEPINSPALLQKLPVVQLLKNFPKFYGTRRFITVFTGPYPEQDQSNPYRSILSL
jgi:hypothetical protein